VTKAESDIYLREHVEPLITQFARELEKHDCRFAMVVCHEEKYIQVSGNVSDISGDLKLASEYSSKYLIGKPQSGKV
jgi:hypothetical protein